jgi:hypothetical protein
MSDPTKNPLIDRLSGAANPGASPQEIARVYGSAPTPMAWLGAYVEVLAYLLLFIFVARLWACLRGAGGHDPGWLATAAGGAGLLSISLTLAGFAIGGALRARGGPDLDGSAALALFDAHVALYVASWALGAVFLGATAALVLGRRMLPRWLGWAAAFVALLDLAAVGLPTSPLAQFPGIVLLLWILAASMVLLRRPALAALAIRAAATASAA